MRHVRDTLLRSDGLRLATFAWLPEGEPRASLVIVHGWGEHARRYGRLSEVLVADGFAVHGFDQRGHGASEGPRARARSLTPHVDDLAAVVANVRAWHDGPWALFGHSVGGLLALRALQRGVLEPNALVLSSPYLRPSHEPHPLVLRTLMLLARLAPRLPASRLDPAAMSRDPIEVEAYRTDSANLHGPVDLGTAAALIRAGVALRAADAPPLRLPTLVLHGSADRVADPAAAVALAERNPGVTLHVEPDGHHELFNDTCRAFITDELLRWLRVRLELAA